MNFKPYINILFCLLFLLNGCSESQQKSKKQLTTNSFNKAELETLFEFSTSGDVMFQNISSIQVDQHGNILIRDFRQDKLTILDPEGEVKQIVGRKGEGPGEFQRLGNFLVANDSLLINDSFAQKIEIYAYSDTSYKREIAVTYENRETSGNLLGLVENEILIARQKPIYAEKKYFSPYRMSTISLVNLKGEIVKDSIFTYKSLESLITDEGKFLSARKSFGNQGYEAFDGQNRVYHIWSDSLAVDYSTMDGQKHNAFSYLLNPHVISQAEKDSALNRRVESNRSEMRQKFPKTKPLIHAMIIDDKDRLWFEINSKNLGTNWYAFSTKGEPLLMVEKPDHSAELQDVRDNNIYWNYINDIGAPTVVKSKIIQ